MRSNLWDVVVDHVSIPSDYVGGWEKSPLTEVDRHQFRTTIRQLHCGSIDACERALDVHPAIDKLALSYASGDTSVSLEVMLQVDNDRVVAVLIAILLVSTIGTDLVTAQDGAEPMKT